MAANGYCIIANPQGDAWQYAQNIYETIKAKTKDVPFQLGRVDIERFADGEIKPKIGMNVRNKECFFIHDSNARPADWFLELTLINHALRNSSAKAVIDVLPYLRFSRQDRKDEGRVPISSRVVADTVQLYAHQVMTIDMHNPSTQACYGVPADNLYSFPTVASYLKKNHPDVLEDVVVMSADAGGAGRATSFAKYIGQEDVAIGHKVRRQAGKVKSIKVIGEVSNRNVIIIDDILDSGNTLVTAANAARVAGAKHVYAYCTHGLFTKGSDGVKEAFDAVFVGDTLKQKEPGVKVISFVPLLAEAIYRVSNGSSISELFK